MCSDNYVNNPLLHKFGIFSNVLRETFAVCKNMAKTKSRLSEIHRLTCTLSTVVCLLLWLPSGRAQVFLTIPVPLSGTTFAPITWQHPGEALDSYTSVSYSCTWSHLEWPPALRRIPDFRRAEERLGKICFVPWGTQSLPVPSFFFQEEQAPRLVTAGMSPDPWRTAIPELWLLCLVSVQRYKHETQALDHAERKCRSVTHHGHKTLWHCSSLWQHHLASCTPKAAPSGVERGKGAVSAVGKHWNLMN